MFKFFKKAAVWACVVFTLFSILVMYTPVANILAKSLTMPAGTQKADIIAVLGGGAYPNGVLGSSSNERLIKAMLLYKEGVAGRVLFSGGSIVKSSAKLAHTVFGLGAGEAGVVESAIMMDIAVKVGIPAKDCVLDRSSLNTYENLRNIAAYMAKEDMKKVAIVTSPTHMKRAVLVAKKLGLDYTAVPVEDSSEYKRSPVGRINLMREALWEYSALVLYRVYGYI